MLALLRGSNDPCSLQRFSGETIAVHAGLEPFGGMLWRVKSLNVDPRLCFGVELRKHVPSARLLVRLHATKSLGLSLHKWR